MSKWLVLLVSGISSVISASSIAQGFVIGGGADPDGGGGVVMEYHKGGEFSGGAENWPWAAALRADADSDLWIGAGMHVQLDLSSWMFVEASFMPGYYNPEDTDLGGNLHFRSLLGLGVSVSDHSAFSLSVDHLSNGGLTSHNPGSEMVSLRYTYTH